MWLLVTAMMFGFACIIVVTVYCCCLLFGCKFCCCVSDTNALLRLLEMLLDWLRFALVVLLVLDCFDLPWLLCFVEGFDSGVLFVLGC